MVLLEQNESDVLYATPREALERDFEANPLSPDEHKRVIENLKGCLVALGCPFGRLNEVCDEVLRKVGPKKFLFDEAIDRVEQERKERGHTSKGR